ncbi:hypothetical protein V3C99_009950 [Haemonchus contortus]
MASRNVEARSRSSGSAERNRGLKKMFRHQLGSKIYKRPSTERVKSESDGRRQEPEVRRKNSGPREASTPTATPRRVITPKTPTISDEEREEFENVAQPRPARAHMRTRELRWKDVSREDQTDDSDSPRSEKSDTEAPSKQEQRSKQGRENETKTEKRLRKAKETIAALRAKLEKRDKKIAFLRTLLMEQDAELKKLDPGRSSRIPTDYDYDDLLPDSHKKLAEGVLETFKKNQLLEKSLSTEENEVLTKYFATPDLPPTKEVVTLIDKAISHALDVLEEPNNDELRAFLKERHNAKLAILDVMLARHDLMPDIWDEKARKMATKTPRRSSSRDRIRARKRDSGRLEKKETQKV